MKNCAYCCNQNEDTAAQCAWCGLEFSGITQASQAAPETNPVSLARNQMITGGLVFLLGATITTITFVSAIKSPSGGVWIIAWGAIFFGGQRFVRGYLDGYFFKWSNKKSKPVARW